jgi:hypothetical protein
LRWRARCGAVDTDAVISSRSASSAPAGYRFPRAVIAVAVRWYLRYGLSYRDVEELLAERGIAVDHVTISRWVQTFTPAFIDAARPARHALGRRWFLDETYVKVAGRWTYFYRAVDQHGQVVDVLISTRRDAAAARAFFARALRVGSSPVEVVLEIDRTARPGPGRPAPARGDLHRVARRPGTTARRNHPPEQRGPPRHGPRVLPRHPAVGRRRRGPMGSLGSLLPNPRRHLPADPSQQAPRKRTHRIPRAGASAVATRTRRAGRVRADPAGQTADRRRGG